MSHHAIFHQVSVSYIILLNLQKKSDLELEYCNQNICSKNCTYKCDIQVERNLYRIIFLVHINIRFKTTIYFLLKDSTKSSTSLVTFI